MASAAISANGSCDISCGASFFATATATSTASVSNFASTASSFWSSAVIAVAIRSMMAPERFSASLRASLVPCWNPRAKAAASASLSLAA